MGDAHSRCGLVALACDSSLSLAKLCLLFLLNQVAAPTATSSSKIDETATLEIILLTKVGALEGERDPMEAKASGTPEHKTL